MPELGVEIQTQVPNMCCEPGCEHGLDVGDAFGGMSIITRVVILVFGVGSRRPVDFAIVV